METLVRASILLHLTWNNLLNDAQYGFMSKRSNLTNLLYAKEEYLSLIDTKQDVDMVFLDLSKSFYVVNHGSLLAKLEASVISPAICRLIAFVRVRIEEAFCLIFQFAMGSPKALSQVLCCPIQRFLPWIIIRIWKCNFEMSYEIGTTPALWICYLFSLVILHWFSKNILNFLELYSISLSFILI